MRSLVVKLAETELFPVEQATFVGDVPIAAAHGFRYLRRSKPCLDPTGGGGARVRGEQIRRRASRLLSIAPISLPYSALAKACAVGSSHDYPRGEDAAWEPMSRAQPDAARQISGASRGSNGSTSLLEIFRRTVSAALARRDCSGPVLSAFLAKNQHFSPHFIETASAAALSYARLARFEFAN